CEPGRDAVCYVFLLDAGPHPRSPLFPYTTLFRSLRVRFALPPCALGEPRTDRTCGSREHKRRCVREVCESAGPPRPSRRCSCIRAPNHSGIRRRRAFWRQALRAFGGATSSVRWFCPSFVHLWEPPVLYGGAERL